MGRRIVYVLLFRMVSGSAGDSVPHDWPRRAKQTVAACRNARNRYTGVAGGDEAVRPSKV